MLPRPTIGRTRSVLDPWDGSGWNKKDFDTLWGAGEGTQRRTPPSGVIQQKMKVSFRLLSPGAELDCPYPFGDVRVRLPTGSQAAGHPVGGGWPAELPATPPGRPRVIPLRRPADVPLAGMFTGVRILSVAQVLP
ncbi:hypothetical protein GCM10025734_04390 [Kitasatospora paranensis]